MSQILKNAGREYAENLSIRLQGKLPDESADSLNYASLSIFSHVAEPRKKDTSMADVLPELKKRQVADVKLLANALIELVTALTDFLSDKDNLLQDRILAGSAIGYLIRQRNFFSVKIFRRFHRDGSLSL